MAVFPTANILFLQRTLCILFLVMLPQAYPQILRLACTRYANFTVEEPNKKLQETFLTLRGVDKTQCQYECIMKNQCKTFNINEDEMACELNEKSTEDERDNVTAVVAAGWTYYSTSYNETLIGRNCAEWKPCKPGFICYDTCDCPGYRCLAMRSCLDLYHQGKRRSGVYKVAGKYDSMYPVICDFETEANSAWTLVASFSFQNRISHNVPFYNSHPKNRDNPNWVDYRIGKPRMEKIRLSSTMWRATCSFPVYKPNIFRDYVRAQLEEVDFRRYKDQKQCKTVDYINIRGHEASNISVPFWQHDRYIFHTDSSIEECAFRPAQGSVDSEDNFGYYNKFNRDFRCTKSDEDTTQYWLGGYV